MFLLHLLIIIVIVAFTFLPSPHDRGRAEHQTVAHLNDFFYIYAKGFTYIPKGLHITCIFPIKLTYATFVFKLLCVLVMIYNFIHLFDKEDI